MSRPSAGAVPWLTVLTLFIQPAFEEKSIGSTTKYPQKSQFLHMWTCKSVISRGHSW
jgi:hypothetical protein